MAEQWNFEATYAGCWVIKHIDDFISIIIKAKHCAKVTIKGG